ncbi:MAG TPA: hypothetical protein VFJ23_05470, partial [Candidatus Nitrosotalea sp.]|nr:hypothetical protein [Candidatus Nitrosotalea sp.]
SYRYYRVMMNVTGLAAAGYVGLQFNGDSTSGHYAWFGESAGQAQKASSISDSKLLVDDPKASFSVARLAVCDIWDSTTSGAFVQCNVSYDNTATTQYAIQGSGFWTGTTQINSITVLTSTGGNLNSGTGITVLGIVS